MLKTWPREKLGGNTPARNSVLAKDPEASCPYAMAMAHNILLEKQIYPNRHMRT